MGQVVSSLHSETCEANDADAPWDSATDFRESLSEPPLPPLLKINRRGNERGLIRSVHNRFSRGAMREGKEISFTASLSARPPVCALATDRCVCAQVLIIAAAGSAAADVCTQ